MAVLAERFALLICHRKEASHTFCLVPKRELSPFGPKAGAFSRRREAAPGRALRSRAFGSCGPLPRGASVSERPRLGGADRAKRGLGVGTVLEYCHKFV